MLHLTSLLSTFNSASINSVYQILFVHSILSSIKEDECSLAHLILRLCGGAIKHSKKSRLQTSTLAVVFINGTSAEEVVRCRLRRWGGLSQFGINNPVRLDPILKYAFGYRCWIRCFDVNKDILGAVAHTFNVLWCTSEVHRSAPVVNSKRVR